MRWVANPAECRIVVTGDFHDQRVPHSIPRRSGRVSPRDGAAD
jgi:hypothetical protein